MTRYKNKSFHWYSLIAIAIIIGLIGFSIATFRARKERDIGMLLAQDIQHLADVFKDINETAGIAGFDFQKNEINFLNIKKDGFVGSEVGSMNLIDPKKWQGPYIRPISDLQEHNYMIVRTKQGYFITPHDGVRLPNGKVIGTDIVLDENANIEQMMQPDGPLSYQGRPLAANIMGQSSLSEPQSCVPNLPEDDE